MGFSSSTRTAISLQLQVRDNAAKEAGGQAEEKRIGTKAGESGIGLSALLKVRRPGSLSTLPVNEKK